ncbi:hypothetical protein ACIQZG_22040 [Lysinibacillus sp. NPDC096418]|uniref:hypothetical protein n=1 Tax=Lysinibacillus sp. NPDC096418 TaxID=3364138 RepID=UPI0037F3CBEC
MEDLSGRKFNRLKALNPTPERKSRKVVWECLCDCGETTYVASDKLKNGSIKSCGCQRRDAGKTLQKTLHSEMNVDGVIIPYLKRKARKDNKTGVKGVSLIKTRSGAERYRSTITVKGKLHYLGTYETLAQAISARKAGEKKYHDPYITKLEEKEND